MNNILKDKIAVLPNKPGCYIYYDKYNTVIYVGKSKKLKNRVNSYFNGAHDLKTTLLVSEIVDLEYVVTSSELEALLLEMNLIKEHNPKYNIRLTDDKSYPYIQITKERHPRLIVTRNPMKRNGMVYGPFPSVYAARETVKLLNKMYPLRDCVKLPKKECLYYHIGQCLGPCIKEVTEDTYDEIIKEVKKFLNGDVSKQIKLFKEKMQMASLELDFEKAAEYRDVIENIEKTIEKQQIYLKDFVDRDIFGFHHDGDKLSISIFYMRSGKIINRDIDMVEYFGNYEEAMSNYIAQFYLNYNHPVPREIMIPYKDELLEDLLKTKVVTPLKGSKKKLIEMVRSNAVEQMDQLKLLHQKKLDRTINAVNELGEMLEIEPPRNIEAFDNSNLMGTDAVSGMVSFIDGKPNKNGYRKFKVQTVDGPDDYATMREVIYRRYLRLITEEKPLPNLLIVDGGKGQVTQALAVLHALNIQIEVIGLKKDKKHLLDCIIDAKGNEIPVSKRSKVYRLLNEIQEEVHRFAITYHRKLRSKSSVHSVLDDIEGLGPERRKKLLKHFSSVYEIKDTNVFTLINIGIPEKVAVRILDKLKDLK